MSRYGEFQLGSVTHGQMATMGHLETMAHFHGMKGNLYNKVGSSKKAQQAWDAQATTERSIGKFHDQVLPIKREKYSVPQEKPVRTGYKQRYN